MQRVKYLCGTDAWGRVHVCCGFVYQAVCALHDSAPVCRCGSVSFAECSWWCLSLDLAAPQQTPLTLSVHADSSAQHTPRKPCSCTSRTTLILLQPQTTRIATPAHPPQPPAAPPVLAAVLQASSPRSTYRHPTVVPAPLTSQRRHTSTHQHPTAVLSPLASQL